MLRKCICLVLWVLASSCVAAQTTYPSKPIEFVVSSQPGGAADIIARLIGPKLTEAWGQPYIVTYKPGAGANIGPEFAARAPKDGYTLLISFAGMTISPSLYPNLRYDPVRDFSPVTLIAKAPLVLVVNPRVKANSLSELVAYAKANPAKLTLGHAGNGTAQHLSGVLLANAAGIDVLEVPFNGSSSVTTALLSDVVEAQFDNMVSIMTQVRAGKLRPIGVSAMTRLKALPDVPTLSESGLRGFEAGSWYGVVAPANTPPEIIDKLNREIVRIVALPDVQDKLVDLGLIPFTNSPTEYGDMIKNDTQRYARIIKQAGIKLE